LLAGLTYQKIDSSKQDTVPIAHYMAVFVHALSGDLWVLRNELDTLLNVLLEILQACIQQLLLVIGQLTDIVDLLNAIWAKSDLGSEEVDALVLVEWAVNEGWLDDVRLALGSSE